MCRLEDGGGTPGLVLAFCTGRHDYEACFAGIRAAVGDAPVIGGPAIGIITADELGCAGHRVGVAVLPSDVGFEVASAGGLDRDERACGDDLGRRLRSRSSGEEALCLLFYDSIKSPPPAPVLNVSSRVIDGLEQGLDRCPPIVGAGLLGTYSFDSGTLFCGSGSAPQHATAALLERPLSVYARIMHGCQPMSDYHTITRAQGQLIYEIDGRPALEVIDDLLGSREWRFRQPLLLVTLGVNHGDPYGPYQEDQYVNRLILGAHPEEEAVILFEADIEPGTRFQFMRRNEQLMLRSAEEGCRDALEHLERAVVEPVLALYIDCAGRAGRFSGAEVEEASIVQETLGSHVPLLGFYSGVEIAPLAGRSRGLDWTGVVLILGREEAS